MTATSTSWTATRTDVPPQESDAPPQERTSQIVVTISVCAAAYRVRRTATRADAPPRESVTAAHCGHVSSPITSIIIIIAASRVRRTASIIIAPIQLQPPREHHHRLKIQISPHIFSRELPPYLHIPPRHPRNTVAHTSPPPIRLCCCRDGHTFTQSHTHTLYPRTQPPYLHTQHSHPLLTHHGAPPHR